MPRDKKPKKGKYTDPKTGEFRHTDGDRRHRLGASAKDAVKHKKQMQEQGGLPPEAAAEADEWSEWDEYGGEGGANA
jgi:hypothetical protein